MRGVPFVALLTLASLSASADPLAENQARFGKLSGTVLVLTQGAKEWIDAHEDLPIEPGDLIHTEESSTAEIIVSAYGLWWIQPESDVLMDRTQTQSGSLHLQMGAVLARLDAARAGLGQRWEFYTPTAVVAIRGTEFGLEFNEHQETHLGVLESEVDIQPAEGPEGMPPPMRIGPLKEAVVPRGKAPRVAPTFSASMLTLTKWRSDLRARQMRASSVYSPLTTTYRQELRSKFVKPVAARHPRPERKLRLRGELKQKQKRPSKADGGML